MADESEQLGGVATGEGPDAMEAQPGASGGEPGASGGQPSEEEMRAAYEAELSKITSSEMILQTTVSLINIGGRRLGLIAPGGASASASATAPERDLEQVRDAIDGARGLMPILERRMPSRELGPLRDAISQLQMAYAREAQSGAAVASTTGSSSTAAPASPNESVKPAQKPDGKAEGDSTPGPGPAQASGRLWVPGR